MRIANEAGIPVEGAIATSFGCPFEGEVPVAQVGADRQALPGPRHAAASGSATPPAWRRRPLVAERCRYLRQHVPELPVALHFHNTRGIGLVNVMAGLAEGIDIFESSFAGLGGCPFAAGATGNICTEDLVYLLHEMGIETGIDLEQAVRRRAPRRAGDRAHACRAR